MKKFLAYRSNQRGIGLIEVMVAFFILAFGLLSLAMFSNNMFSETGANKADAEALMLAQQQMETFREYAAENGADLLADDFSSLLIGSAGKVIGVNATFDLTTSTVSGTNPYTMIAKVTWNDAEGTQKEVELKSLTSAPDPALLAALVAGELTGGGFVDSPSGSAEYGDGQYSPSDNSDDVSEQYGDILGVKVYLDVPDYILTDSNNNILLKSKTGFGRITGRVYIEASSKYDEPDEILAYAQQVIVKPSDTGVCPLVEEDDGSLAVNYVYESSGGLKYSYLTYNCFFGTGWYGSIGLFVTSDKVNGATGAYGNEIPEMCGGDANVTDDGSDESDHPQIISIRTYRGYVPRYSSEDLDGNGHLDDPAVDGSGNRIYLSDGMAERALYGDTSGSSVDAPDTHDFVLITGNGSVSDTTCNSLLAQPSLEQFQNNRGSFVCLYDEYGTRTCPSILPVDLGEPVTTTPHTISGVISGDFSETSFTLSTSQSENCSIDMGTKVWSCTVYDVGSGWEGSVNLVSNDDSAVCSTASFVFGDELNNTVVSDVDMSSSPFEVAASSAGCIDGGAGDGGTPVPTTFTATITVENYSTNGASFIGLPQLNPADEGSCGSVSYVPAKSGNTPGTASFTCILRNSFQGSVSFSAAPTYSKTTGNNTSQVDLQISQEASASNSWVIKVK